MIAMEASCLMSARSFSRSALGVPQDWLRSMLQRPATHMYPSQQKCATDLLQRCRTPLRSLCQSKRQEFEQLRSSSGERSLERRDSAQSFLALQGSKYQAAFGTTIKSPARRRSSKVGSGRYAASVIRTSSGRKRIRRAKDGDGEEDDDDAEEVCGLLCSSVMDASSSV